VSRDPQPPILVKRDATDFSALCQQCIFEKNSPFHPDRAWARGENHADVTVSGTLPLDEEEAWVKCSYGHEHLVLRAGSERARNFGY
jgi:hypothetical protein